MKLFKRLIRLTRLTRLIRQINKQANGQVKQVRRFRWSKQALFFAERSNLSDKEIKACEAWIEENMFIVGGQHILSWLDSIGYNNRIIK